MSEVEVQVASGREIVLMLSGWTLIELASQASFGASPTAFIILICFGISL